MSYSQKAGLDPYSHSAMAHLDMVVLPKLACVMLWYKMG